MRGVNKLKQGALGVSVGDYGSGGDLFTVGENEAGRDAIFYANFFYLGIGANFCAGLCGRGGHGLRECAYSAGGKVRLTCWVGISSGAKQHNQCAACRPRPQESPENSTRSDTRAQEFSFKILSNYIRDSGRSPAQQTIQVFLAKAAN